MLSLNQHLASLPQSATIELADTVRRLQASGVPVVALQTGDPDFATPAPIIHAATQAMQEGLTHYSNSRGLPAFRQAIARRLQIDHNLEADPDREILVTHGAVHAYYVALQAILEPGDDILIPDPSWQTHANLARMLRANVYRVPASIEEDFLPSMAMWEKMRTPRTRAIVLNFPNNPSGMVAPRDYLLQVLAWAQDHDLWIISDEVYGRLLFEDNVHTSVASLPDAKSRTLLVNSLSKSYAMTGWRVGYLVAPETIIDQALKASQNSITNLAPFIQKAATFALTDDAMQGEVEAMRTAYAQRRQRVLDLHRPDSRLAIRAPRGGFYFFIDIRQTEVDSMTAARQLLDAYHICVVPGIVYGDASDGYLRMTIAADIETIEKGYQGILQWADAT